MAKAEKPRCGGHTQPHTPWPLGLPCLPSLPHTLILIRAQRSLQSMGLSRVFSNTTVQKHIQFSRSFVSDSLRPHELQHARPPCPSNESTLHKRWPKYWSFSFSIIPSKEHPGQISFRMDWLDLLVVQGTLKSLLQHHSSKAYSVQSLICVRLFATP